MNSVHCAWANLIEVIVAECSRPYEGIDVVLMDLLMEVLARLNVRETQHVLYKESCLNLGTVAVSLLKRLREVMQSTDVRLNIMDVNKMCDFLCGSVVNQQD